MSAIASGTDPVVLLAKLHEQLDAARLRRGWALERLDAIAHTLPRPEDVHPDQLTAAERADLNARIANAVAALRAVAPPPDPHNPMYPEHVGWGWLTALMCIGIALPIIAGVVALAIWRGIGPAHEWTDAEVFGMVMLMGLLGGSVHLVTSLATHLGRRDLTRNWVPYYLLLPIQGATLAPIVYLLLRVGVVGNNDVKSLNLIGIFGIAALTGLFSRQAIEMLANTADAMFKKTADTPGAAARKAQAGTTVGSDEEPAQPVPQP